MKKVIWKENDCEAVAIYFDYEKDFPQLGSKWICETCGDAFTDCDCYADSLINLIESKIDTLYHAECDENDYEHVAGLVEGWGL